MLLSLFSTLIFASSFVYAANDWSTPCLSGQCSYEVNNGTANGTLTLSGPTNAISDITPAAGWTILDCDPTAADQDVRLVCTGSQQDCDHVYQGDVVDTIVRLPEDCGHMPFARVASEWVHENQTVPDHVAVQLRRQNSSNSTIRGFTLDTDWAAVGTTHNRTVLFKIEGGNTPTTSDDDTRVGRRSLLHPSANISKSSAVNADQSFTLLDQSISCPAIGDLPALNEHAKLGIEAKANGQLGYGFTASGTLFPPSVDDIAIFTALDVTMAGILSIDATAGATLDTGRQRIFSVPIAGLEFSKFFQIGPVFFVDVQGTAQMAAQMNMGVNLAYSLSGAKISFPSSSDSSVGNIGPADTNLQLSAGSSGKIDATLTAHVIPGIQFGITALTAVSANVNLDVDAFGKLDMTLAGSVPATTSQSIASTTSTTSSYMSSSSISAISSSNISSSVFATTSSPKASLSTSSILSSAGTNASSITSVGSTTTASIAATATSGADAGGSIPADVAPTVRAGGTSQSGGSDTIGGTVYTSSANIRTVTQGISATAVVTSPAISQSAPSSSTNASSIANATVISSPTSSKPVYVTATPSNSVHSNSTVRTVTTPIVRTHTVTGLETLTSLETLTTVETIKTVEPTTSLELVTLTGSDAAAPTSLSIAGRSDSPSFSGCVDVSTGVTVSMGADASFFGLFDKSKSVTLFTKSFDLFKKCFGDGPVSATPARRRIRATGYTHRHRMGRRQRHEVTKRGAELTCLPSLSGPLAGIVNQLIPSSQIEASE